MSQSDYIRYKKLSNQLLHVKKWNAVLDAQDYTNYKEYYLESNISNTKPTLNKLNIEGYTTVFGMNKDISNCPTYIYNVCKNTHLNANRVLVTDHRTGAYEINNYPIKKII
jgi:hypothetical protein